MRKGGNLGRSAIRANQSPVIELVCVICEVPVIATEAPLLHLRATVAEYFRDALCEVGFLRMGYFVYGSRMNRA